MIVNVSHNACVTWRQYDVQQTFDVYIIFAVLLFIFLLGLFGNIMLIIIIVTKKGMRTLPNFLIVNLAVGDTIFLIAHVLSTIPTYILSKFHADNKFCKLQVFTRHFTLGISIFTLMLLAIDRLRVIVCPLRRHLSPNQSKWFAAIGLIIIWMTSVIMATPFTIKSNIVRVNISNINCLYTEICTSRIEYDSYQEKFQHFWITFSIYFIIPLFSIGICYICIAVYLISRTHVGHHVVSTVQVTSRQKLAKIVLCLIIVFMFCKLPEQIHKFYVIICDEAYVGIQIFSEVFSFIYPCLNPMTLCILSVTYRRQFVSCILHCKTISDNDVRRNSAPLFTGQMIITPGPHGLSTSSSKLTKMNTYSPYMETQKFIF